MKKIKRSWQSTIYGKKETIPNIESSVRSRLLTKYCHVCQACRVKFTKKDKMLGLHHILPRNRGGTDDEENLILLCDPCHDIIEVNTTQFSSYDLIAYCFSKRKCDKVKIGKTEYGTKWQSWVYGGKKNPIVVEA